MISPLPPKAMPDALYNSKEASKLLGIHRNSLRRFVKMNLITPTENFITGRCLFEGRELERFWYSRIHISQL
jgi:DNA-binding transcriptional MerR regulator